MRACASWGGGGGGEEEAASCYFPPILYNALVRVIKFSFFVNFNIFYSQISCKMIFMHLHISSTHIYNKKIYFY